MTVAVHQLLPDFAYGDAIGLAAIKTQDMLRDMGFVSQIYAANIDPRLAKVGQQSQLMWECIGPEDVVIYRLSIGSSLAAELPRRGLRTVVIYHNITPPRYYDGTNPTVVHRLVQAREDLQSLAPYAELVIADSSFNMNEAVRAGARHTATIPPPVDLNRLQPRPSHPSDPPLLLCVGRLAPNKRHDDLLRILAALRATTSPQARMVLAGHSVDTESYASRLRQLAHDLDIDDAVHMPGKGIDDNELGDMYAKATIYLSTSEHEGFCIPLLEAMKFAIPIVAYAAGAVPETLGEAGILLESKDPLIWAEVIDRVLRDGALRSQLRAAGQRRLRDFDHAVISEKLRGALTTVGIAPQPAASVPV